MVDRYTEVIDTLFSLQLSTFGNSIESSIFRQQIAFVAFSQAKEKPVRSVLCSRRCFPTKISVQADSSVSTR